MATDITYNNKVIANLADGKTATLVCANKKAVSDIVVKFGAKGSITYNGVTTEVESGKTALLACANKKMLTNAVIVVSSGASEKDITVYIANDSDTSIYYALSGVKENMTWSEWIDATGGTFGDSGSIWIEGENLYCGSYAEIYNSNGEQQIPDSVIVENETYCSYEVFEGL